MDSGYNTPDGYEGGYADTMYDGQYFAASGAIPVVELTLADGLVHYWDLDETTGTRVDIVGTADLAESGVVATKSGISDNGVLFSDGAEQLSTTTITETGPWTLSLWVNSTNGAPANFFNPNTGDVSISINSVETGDVTVVDGAGFAYALASGSNAITTAQWENLVLAFDPTGSTNYDKLRLYVDGSYVSWAVDAAGPVPGTLDFSDFILSVRVGLDEVAVWNRVLSSTNISDLYLGGTGTFYPF